MKKYFPLYLFLLFILGGHFGFAKGDLDSLFADLRNKNLHDTLRAVSIMNLTFARPEPKFDTIVPLIEEGYQLAIKHHKNGLATGLLGRKIYFYVHNGRGIEAFSICQQMALLGEKEKDDNILGQSYELRGSVFQSFNMLSKAADELKQAIYYYEKAGNKEAENKSRYLLGYYSFNSKDYATALPNFRKAYAYMLSVPKSDVNILYEYCGWVGNTFRQMKQFDSALYYRRLAMDYAYKGEGKWNIAEAHRYTGVVYLRAAKFDSALVYFKKAYNLFGEMTGKDRMWLMQYFIAETYSEMKNVAKSAKELDVLLDKKSGTKDIYTLYEGNLLGTIVYEKNNELKKSIACYKDYILYKDSVEKSDKQGAVTELDAKLKFEHEESLMALKQAEKDAEAKREVEKQALIRNILIGGFCVVGLFLIVVYRNYIQKQKANKLLEAQKNEIEAQKKEIQDSINYAQNIQSAVLPDTSEIEKHFTEMFIFYRPKDVVSGDFFWYNKTKDGVLIAAADCTGHGVPGAFMSMIGSYELNNSVSEKGIFEPGKILSHINVSLKKRLRQNAEQSNSKDGMDIAICGFDLKNNKLQYAGANRPLYIIRDNKPLEFAPTKAAIGGYTEDNKEFNNTDIQLQKGDCVYMYTDGYSDQFGGEKNKKLTTKNFKTLLQSIANLNMKEQYKALEKYFYEWKGNFEQLDDVLVIGIRI